MDLATATYITYIPVLVLLFSFIIHPRKIYAIITAFTIFALLVTSILGLFDMILYADWGMRLNPQLLPALQHPKGMLACVTPLQLIVIILVEVGIVLGFIFLYFFLFKSFKKQEKAKWWNFFILLIYAALMIIPMRGGIQLTPINFSRVYFSTNLYANHAATNPYWSFFHRLIYSDNRVKKLTLIEPGLCEEIMTNTMKEEQEKIPIYIKSKNGGPVNVILIILESFSNKTIEPLGGAPDFTPHFNQLAKEGILFSRFFSCGNRSDKGIAALLASYPALVGPYSVLYFPEKMKNLDYLSKYFKHNHYQTHFYYAGEAEFYNTKSLVLQSEFEHLVSVSDFPASAKQQNWGVPDALFYERIVNDLKTFSPPFFLVTYNISLHPPYDIPGLENRDYAHAVSYCDKYLGDFVAQLKASPFWENTLLIITSDHGTLDFVSTSLSDPRSHQIPMLWTGGAVDTSFVNEKTGMQTDLSVTLVQQLGWTANPNPFSKNLFGKKEYAFYFNPNGYGFSAPNFGYYYDLEVNHIDFFNDNKFQKNDSLLYFSKAFVQYLHFDFQQKNHATP
jgi:phosphoglycerol transferase MdoB-like AlkP superfamily enzyme